MIQLFKPIFDGDSRQEVLSGIAECLDTGWTGLGFKTVTFENRFKLYTNVPHAHFLNSATSGLHLALEIIKRKSIGKRYAVLTTAMTFIATNHVIKHAGFEPWFVDIDNSLTIDPNILDRELRLHREDVAAVMFVGMGGSVGNLLRVRDVCDEYGVPLIFDASHCMGTHIDFNHVGVEAHFTVFSFQAVKNLSTGDSGMLVCMNTEDDKLARKLSWLGIDKDTYTRQETGGNWDYDITEIGYKYHGNSIMAAMGLASLKNVAPHNAMRRNQAKCYDEAFKDHEAIRLIRMPEGEYLSSRHLYQIRVPSDYRDSLIRVARHRDIQLGVHYRASTEYKMYASHAVFTSLSILAGRELVSLPIGPHLGGSDIGKVIEVILGYFI